MSRKKNRSAATATTAQTLTPTSSLQETDAPKLQPAPKPATRVRQRNLLERVMHVLGSLHMAIILLSTAVVVLFLGSWLESKFDARISQEFVYRTWWFTVLLFLFAINIFFAAVKKWPWKKHQTGFLITHVGLLTMLAGGILNSLAGVDAEMQLLDSAYLAAQRKNGISQQTDTIFYRDQGLITVEHVRQRGTIVRNTPKPSGEEEVLSVNKYPFNPGVATWGDPAFARQGAFLVRFLDGLASPLPRAWSQTLPNGVRLSVDAFYPHAIKDLYKAAANGEGFPAVKVLLSSERFSALEGDWLALDPRKPNNAYQDLGPARMELTGVIPESLINDFLQPPAADQLGLKGKLVVQIADRKVVLDIADTQQRLMSGGMLNLGDTPWRIKSLTYQASARLEEKQDSKALDPCVQFVLVSPQGRTYEFEVFARIQASPPLTTPPEMSATTPEPEPLCLYHPPDFLFGADAQRLKGLVQLAQSASGKLYYRAFTHRGGRFSVEVAGPVQLKHGYDIWPFMSGRFEVSLHYQHAEEKVLFAPRHERPGLRRAGLYQVLQCRLEGFRTGEKNTEDGSPAGPRVFHLAMGGQEQSATETVTITSKRDPKSGTYVEEFYRITFAPLTERLGFDVKLLRAESQIDPGTDRAATYSSFVLVTDPPARPLTKADRPQGWQRFLAWVTGDTPPAADKAVRQEAMITMNQPLDYRGYKLYQSNFVPVTDDRGRPMDDERGRPLHISGFTVGRDPGLWLKYLGSSMLALGIACMFYMRAYFFKPRSRPALAGGNK